MILTGRGNIFAAAFSAAAKAAAGLSASVITSSATPAFAIASRSTESAAPRTVPSPVTNHASTCGATVFTTPVISLSANIPSTANVVTPSLRVS